MNRAVFRERRKLLGLSQVQLAQKSGLSLPTIQNIEGSRANPTLEVAEKLCRALGLTLEVRPTPFPWEELVRHGLPLVNEGFAVPHESARSRAKLVSLIRLACLEPLDSRQQEALMALIVAIRDHYPSVYNSELRRSPGVARLLEQTPWNGKIIKLRRIALSAISKYL